MTQYNGSRARWFVLATSFVVAVLAFWSISQQPSRPPLAACLAAARTKIIAESKTTGRLNITPGERILVTLEDDSTEEVEIVAVRKERTAVGSRTLVDVRCRGAQKTIRIGEGL